MSREMYAARPEHVDPIESSLWWKLLNRSAWELFGLILAILLMTWLVLQIRAWFTGGDDPAESDHQLLASIRDLKRQGDLTEEEYRSIKSRLVTRLGDPAAPSD